MDPPDKPEDDRNEVGLGAHARLLRGQPKRKAKSGDVDPALQSSYPPQCERLAAIGRRDVAKPRECQDAERHAAFVFQALLEGR